MPATWSSSERPISVRTVWVDGIRHAILSPDDPLINSKSRRRPHVPRNKSYSPEYQESESTLDRLNSCFANLYVVVGNNLSQNKTSSRIYRKLSAPPCPRMSTSASRTGKLESLSNDVRRIKKGLRTQTEQSIDALIDKPIFRDEISGKRTPESELDSDFDITECKRTGRLDAFWNPLFERVLQWIDLSGRAQIHDFEDDFGEALSREEDRKWSPIKRRLSRFRRESSVEKDPVTAPSCMLHRDRSTDRFGGEQSKTLLKSLPKMKSSREESCDADEKHARSLKSNVDESSNVGKAYRKVSTVWSPPGRLQLHIVMPNLISKENNMSSQESLITN